MSNENERYIDLSNLQTKSDMNLNYLANIFGRVKVGDESTEMTPKSYLGTLEFKGDDDQQIQLNSSQSDTNIIVNFKHNKNAKGLGNELFELKFDEGTEQLTLTQKFSHDKYGHFVDNAEASNNSITTKIPIEKILNKGTIVPDISEANQGVLKFTYMPPETQENTSSIENQEETN